MTTSRSRKWWNTLYMTDVDLIRVWRGWGAPMISQSMTQVTIESPTATYAQIHVNNWLDIQPWCLRNNMLFLRLVSGEIFQLHLTLKWSIPAHRNKPRISNPESVIHIANPPFGISLHSMPLVCTLHRTKRHSIVVLQREQLPSFKSECVNDSLDPWQFSTFESESYALLTTKVLAII